MHKRALTLSIALLFTLLAGLTGSTGYAAPPAAAYPRPALQVDLPIHGWTVCAVGGLEAIPGVGQRQVFNLCQGNGLEIKSYCLQPNFPAPAQGTLCSDVGGNRYWCGDQVQQLQFLTILATPAPAPTRTQTPTASATSPAIVTATLMPTRTLTPAVPATPAVTPSTTPLAAQATATPYQRPHPGGPGNGGYIAAGFGLLMLLLTFSTGLAAWRWLRAVTGAGNRPA